MLIFTNDEYVSEYQIVDFFLGSKLKDEVMKIMPVQKVSAAGQITRFKAFVAVGDEAGHVGLGVKCAKEVRLALDQFFVGFSFAIFFVLMVDAFASKWRGCMSADAISAP